MMPIMYIITEYLKEGLYWVIMILVFVSKSIYIVSFFQYL